MVQAIATLIVDEDAVAMEIRDGMAFHHVFERPEMSSNVSERASMAVTAGVATRIQFEADLTRVFRPLPGTAVVDRDRSAAYLLKLYEMSKLSSKQKGAIAFPLICDNCGESSIMPSDDGTTMGLTHMTLGLRCDVCDHRTHLQVPTGCAVVIRKQDRRRS